MLFSRLLFIGSTCILAIQCAPDRKQGKTIAPSASDSIAPDAEYNTCMRNCDITWGDGPQGNTPQERTAREELEAEQRGCYDDCLVDLQARSNNAGGQGGRQGGGRGGSAVQRN